MPIVRIDIQSGKTTEYKRQLLHGVRDAIVSELGVPGERVMQRVVETAREDIDASEARSDRLTIIEITMLPRGKELKEALFRAVASRLGADPGITQHDLVVLLNDPAAECFFVNGRMLCDGPGDSAPELAEVESAEIPPDEPSAEPRGDEVSNEPAPAEELDQ
jgi:phenylpyruvate tautomerase PptA (4-oxalocrotonate tautomerase family)